MSALDRLRPPRAAAVVRAARVRRAAWLATCACAAVVATAARAQPFDAPPPPGPPRPLQIAAPVEQRLANGLRIVLAERRGVGLVTAELIVRSGAEADPPQRAGLASLTAGLLTRGTQRHDAPALARAAESLGGRLESGAGWDRSEVAITVMVPKLDAALGLVAESVRAPRFAPAELERLRAETLDGLKIAYARPATLARLAAHHLLFGAGPYGHPADGTPASLRRIRRADVVGLHAARYRPDNAVLVLAGDLDAATALALAQRHFGGWKAAAGAPAAASPGAPGEASPQAAAVVEMPGSGQAAVVVAAALPRLGADRATAAVTNAVLGGGFSSRLNQQIRIRRGLSYGAGSRLEARRDGGVLDVVVQTKNDSAAEVAALVQAELDRLAAAPVEPAELGARKAALIGEFSRGVETTAGLAATLGSLVVAGLPPDELRHRIDAIAAVDADAVRRFATANLAPSGRRTVVAGDAGVFAPALAKVLPGIVVVPAAELDIDDGAGLRAPTGRDRGRKSTIP